MRSSQRQKTSISGAIGSLVDSHLKDRAGLTRIRELSLVVRATSALIHELQKERGLSSGLVAGAGRRFAQDLPAQTLRTDRALLEATETWTTLGPEPRRGALEAAMADARASLVELAQFRSDVRALALTPNTVVQKFSGIVDRLLVVIAEVPGTSPHPQVTMALIALLNFILAKEYTGQMRALGSAVCAQAEFEPFQFERFQTLAKQREEALSIFVRHAARDQIDRWSDLQTSESFFQWEAYKRTLEKSGEEGRGLLPDADDWYRWSTATIDTMRTAEVGLLDGLDELCIHILAETRSAWEDAQESPDALDATLQLRLERARVRLLEERRDLRLQNAPQTGAEPAGPVGLMELVELSAAAADQVHQWRRDVELWTQTIREAQEKVRLAKILALNATIDAFRPAQIAEGAQDLARSLTDWARDLETRFSGLAAEADKVLAAHEKWQGRALGFWHQEADKKS